MPSAGMWMLAILAVTLIATGLPAFSVLIGVSAVFAAGGLATGTIGLPLLTALPVRLVGLLESDLLQALPLYVLMGALLHRLPLADILFRAGARLLGRSRAASQLSALALGGLLAPMSGSVGASVATLARVVHPRLEARGVPADRGLALVCVASTLGVVVPPSLVLILLGDAMMRAHTEAVNATGIAVRIINTQDVFRGALVPAAIFLSLAVIVVAWRARKDPLVAKSQIAPVTAGEWAAAAFAAGLILTLLGGVALGYLFAVEAAATGAVTLLAAGVVTRRLDLVTMRLVLADTLAVTGALFALFAAATTFTLVARAFGTDRLLEAWVSGLGPRMAPIAVLALLAACAFVLDAFEILFVVIPIVMPPLLKVAPDAVWVSVLAMLVLQASFLAPPFGYAFVMARTQTRSATPALAMARALAPFLGAQFLVVLAVAFFPALTHVGQSAPAAQTAPTPGADGDELSRQLERNDEVQERE